MKKEISRDLKDFFAKEIRDYSIYACQRAIPSGIDGFKPSQRKILYGMMKEYPTQEVKVSIASATIMATTCYHHGSLEGVMVNMAQSFPGSNNLPLLEGIGQFGSRLSPDPAASRYIFTKLTPHCKQIFNPIDNDILEWEEDDGTRVEPKYYLPILPMVLVNGAKGMGTGFATSIFGYDPKYLAAKIKTILEGGKVKTLTPWYRGFTGTIFKNEDEQTSVTGCLKVENTTTIIITELPVGTYTISYREVLNKLEDKGLIKSYDDNSTEEKTEFVVKVSRETTQLEHDELLSLFKLVSKDTENITVWDENFKIKKFNSAVDLLYWFVEFRLTKYEDRRLHMIKSSEAIVEKLDEQMRFIKLYLKKAKEWSQTKTADIKTELISQSFKNVDDLLNIRISKLTQDSIDELSQKIKDEKSEIERLNKCTAKDLYLEDLNNLKLPS